MMNCLHNTFFVKYVFNLIDLFLFSRITHLNKSQLLTFNICFNRLTNRRLSQIGVFTYVNTSMFSDLHNKVAKDRDRKKNSDSRSVRSSIAGMVFYARLYV